MVQAGRKNARKNSSQRIKRCHPLADKGMKDNRYRYNSVTLTNTKTNREKERKHRHAKRLDIRKKKKKKKKKNTTRRASPLTVYHRKSAPIYQSITIKRTRAAYAKDHSEGLSHDGEAHFATQPTPTTTLERDAEHTVLSTPKSALARTTLPLFSAGTHDVLECP